jgi:hypothetical protein
LIKPISVKNKTMLSQYTWWDFAKVVGIALFSYYAYVIWTYYREDIREWINNRGSKPLQENPSDEEEDSSGLYAVRQYASPSVEETSLAPVVDNPSHTDLMGLAVDQDQEFTIPLPGEIQRPAEQSLSQLLSVSQRLQCNEQGVMVANDPADQEAERLASVINKQQEHRQAFKDISFTR